MHASRLDQPGAARPPVHRSLLFRWLALAGLMAAVAVPSMNLASSTGAAKPGGSTNVSANLDQCQNGQVGPPIVLSPCLNGTLGGTGYSDWVNGNVNGSKAHWREGEMLTYRSTLSGLSSGGHDLVIHYDTVHGGKHAIDYLGSFDATETTALAATTFHRNNNNPCVDILGSASGSGCSAIGTPVTTPSTVPIGAATLTNCGGSAGTFFGTQPTDQAVSVFAPTAAGATSTGTLTYTAQNTPSGTGQCSTTVKIHFTLANAAPTGGWKVVLAWGGHIASQLNWQAGNSASSISGSPYHMALDTLDGVTLGSQDRALSTSAIFFTPTLTTTIVDDSTGSTPTFASGEALHDTAAFTSGSFGIPIGGTVTYYYLSGADVVANDSSTGCSDSVTAGAVPSTVSTANITSTTGAIGASSAETPTDAGNYAFYAVYSGSGPNQTTTSLCEPFSITKASPTFSTQQTITPDDSVTFSGLTSDAGGTVTFTLWSGLDCTGTSHEFTAVSLVAGTNTYDLDNTTYTVSPNQAADYTWEVHYSGDSNNNELDICEDGGTNPDTTTRPVEQFSIAGS